MMPRTTRATLLSRVRNLDDENSWREFESLYRDFVLVACRRRGLQQSDAEDILQIVLVRLSRSLPGFRYDPSRGRFRDYLSRVVLHAIYRQQGARNEMTSAMLLEDLSAPREEVENLENEWVEHHYRRAVKSIRQSHSKKVLAVFEDLLAGYTTEQVAERHDMGLEAIRKSRQRLRARLQEQIAKQVAHEDQPPGNSSPLTP